MPIRHFVSIPYRYPKISASYINFSLSTSLFQFLIGILKSILALLKGATLLLFQFLIGILKSLTLKNQVSTLQGFQFLIGILKSMVILTVKISIEYVSIPYRYPKIQHTEWYADSRY